MKGMFKRIACVLAGFIITTCALAQEPDLRQDYQLAAGDRVRVSVYGHDDLSGEFEVDGAGQLSLPLIQDVSAEGKTLNELEAIIKVELEPDYLLNPRVSVEVLAYRPFYIMGEVKQPGGYPYVSGMTVINAVALAGGFTYRANKKSLQIMRERTNNEIEVSPDTQVMPGDVIEVGERFF
jgi:protein involved in polysaccharide export with SLBB domain